MYIPIATPVELTFIDEFKTFVFSFFPQSGDPEPIIRIIIIILLVITSLIFGILSYSYYAKLRKYKKMRKYLAPSSTLITQEQEALKNKAFWCAIISIVSGIMAIQMIFFPPSSSPSDDTMFSGGDFYTHPAERYVILGCIFLIRLIYFIMQTDFILITYLTALRPLALLLLVEVKADDTSLDVDALPDTKQSIAWDFNLPDITIANIVQSSILG